MIKLTKKLAQTSLVLATVALAACLDENKETEPDACVLQPSNTPCNPEDPSTKNATILPGPFLGNDVDEVIPEIAIVDLNGDNQLDILASVTDYYTHKTFKAFINKGNREFQDETSTLFPAAQNPDLASLTDWVSKFYFVDMNGDGLKDVIANSSNPGVGTGDYIFLQQNDGTYSQANANTFPAKGSFFPIKIDGDEKTDLLVAKTTGDTLTWTTLINTSANNAMAFELGAAQPLSFIGEDKIAFIEDPAIIDLDGDNDLDLLYAGPKWKHGGFVNEAADFTALLNSGNNAFVDGTTTIFGATPPSLMGGGQTVVADFNGDNKEDILIAGGGYDGPPYPGERNILLTASDTGGYSDSEINNPLFNASHFTHSLAAGDLDNDGDIDIVFSDVASGSSWVLGKVLKNDGAGNFTEVRFPFPNASLYGTTGAPQWPEGDINAWTATKIADMDNDGYNDVILGAQFRTTNSLVYWNDKSGSGIFK